MDLDESGETSAKRARSRSHSAKPKTSQEKGFKDLVQEKKVMKLRRKSQDAKNKRGLNVMGRAGEADRHYVDKMPKHLFSGKTRGQKTRDYR